MACLLMSSQWDYIDELWQNSWKSTMESHMETSQAVASVLSCWTNFQCISVFCGCVANSRPKVVYTNSCGCSNSFDVWYGNMIEHLCFSVQLAQHYDPTHSTLKIFTGSRQKIWCWRWTRIRERQRGSFAELFNARWLAFGSDMNWRFIPFLGLFNLW